MAIIQLPKTPSAIPTANPATAGAPTATSVPLGDGMDSIPLQSPPNPTGAAGEIPNWLQWIQAIFGISADAAATIQALGPQSALQVTPLTFQSIEQEGRWKPVNLVDQVSSDSRDFVLVQQNQNAQNSSSQETVLAERYGQITTHQRSIFTVTCGEVSEVEIDATWWSDGLEIWAGFCGMASHIGFASVFNDTASISLQAMPFGNYYPAKVLITWTGWVNPVGNDYREFRGGIVISANGACGTSGQQMVSNTDSPCYMQHWKKGDTKPSDLTWDPNNGFTLTVKSLSPGSLP